MKRLALDFRINEERLAESKVSVDSTTLSHCMTVNTAKPWLKDNR